MKHWLWKFIILSGIVFSVGCSKDNKDAGQKTFTHELIHDSYLIEKKDPATGEFICQTHQHSFVGASQEDITGEYCATLQNEFVNDGCAMDERKDLFARKCSPMKFRSFNPAVDGLKNAPNLETLSVDASGQLTLKPLSNDRIQAYHEKIQIEPLLMNLRVKDIVAERARRPMMTDLTVMRRSVFQGMIEDLDACGMSLFGPRPCSVVTPKNNYPVALHNRYSMFASRLVKINDKPYYMVGWRVERDSRKDDGGEDVAHYIVTFEIHAEESTWRADRAYIHAAQPNDQYNAFQLNWFVDRLRIGGDLVRSSLATFTFMKLDLHKPVVQGTDEAG